MFPLIRMIIFDCDGVLLNTELLAVHHHQRKIRRLFGVELDKTQAAHIFVGRYGSEPADIFKQLYNLVLPDDYGDDFWPEIVRMAPQELKIVDGVAAAIERLDLPVCIASNSPREWLSFSLGQTNLFELEKERHPLSMDCVFYAGMNGENNPPKKPLPDLFWLAMAEMRRIHSQLNDLQAGDVLVIGDSTNDMLAAQAAGMRGWGFTGGGHCDEHYASRLIEHRAELIFDDMSRLPAMIAAEAVKAGCSAA